MKKRTINIIAVFSLLLIATATSALAQGIVPSTRVDIPFDFTVGNVHLPSGEYIVSKNGDTLVLRNTSGKGSVATLPGRTTQDKSQPSASRLLFKRYGTQYFLSQVWLPGEGLRRELKVKSSELQAAKSARSMAIATHTTERPTSNQRTHSAPRSANESNF